MGAKVLSWARRLAPRDGWTNEELAELYRVEHALRQAGIAVETDRGLSDEGDPWFVFCHADGHVVVHIALIGGLYHLYCATLPEPLVGPSFAALTKAFVGTLPPSRQGGISGRVVAHPSALLSLLVAAAMFSVDALTRHSAHAADLPVSPHGHLPLTDLTPPGVNKSVVVKQFADTFAAAVRRGSSLEAPETLWRAVEAAALGFSALVAATLAIDVEGETNPISTRETSADIGDGFVYGAVRSHANDVVDPGFGSTALAAGSTAVQNAVWSGPVSLVPAFKPQPPIADATSIAGIHGDSGNLSGAAAGTLLQRVQTALPAASGIAKLTLSGEVAVAADFAGIHTLDITLGTGGGTLDLGQAGTLLHLVLSGGGALTLTHAEAAASIEASSGTTAALTLSYDQPSDAPLAQTLVLDGATHVSVRRASPPDVHSSPPGVHSSPMVNLVIDSQGTQINDLTLIDPVLGPLMSFSIQVIGQQDLMLNESASTFSVSTLNASALTGRLTVGVDLSTSLSATNLSFSSSNFVVTPQDNIALENLRNYTRIDLGVDLNNVILSHASDVISAPGPITLALDLGGLNTSAAPMTIGLINANDVNNLYLTSHGTVDSVQMIDAGALTNLELTGTGSLQIGSLTSVAAANAQSVAIDAHGLTGSLSLDASAIADTAGGGRQVSIITGAGNSVITDRSTTESLNFMIGTGHALVAVAGGASLITISGLKVTDQVNVGAGTSVDTFINGMTTLLPHQGAIDASGSLMAAAATAGGLVESNAQHQAVLFSYKGDAYVFIDVAGNHVFDPSLDAIVKLTGVSPASDLTGVFHSA